MKARPSDAAPKASDDDPRAATLEATIVLEKSPLDRLREDILAKGRTSIINLFHSWDENGDGKVSRAEFREAVLLLGYTKDTGVIDSLFDRMDPDRSGKIDYAEMDQTLRRSVHKPGAPLSVARARWLLPKRSLVYVFGTGTMKKKAICKTLSYMFRSVVLSEASLKADELERAGSKLAAELAEDEFEGRRIKPRVLRKLFRQAYDEQQGPFFLFDLPSLEEMQDFDEEFGGPRAVLWLEMDGWKDPAKGAQLRERYGERKLLLEVDAAQMPDAIAQQLELFLCARAHRETTAKEEHERQLIHAARERAQRQREYLQEASQRMAHARREYAKSKADSLDYTICRQLAGWKRQVADREAASSARSSARSSSRASRAQSAAAAGPPWRPQGPPRVVPGTTPAWDSTLLSFTSPIAPLPGSPRAPLMATGSCSPRDIIARRQIHSAEGRCRKAAAPSAAAKHCRPPSYLSEPSSLPGVKLLYGNPVIPRRQTPRSARGTRGEPRKSCNEEMLAHRLSR